MGGVSFQGHRNLRGVLHFEGPQDAGCFELLCQTNFIRVVYP